MRARLRPRPRSRSDVTTDVAAAVAARKVRQVRDRGGARRCRRDAARARVGRAARRAARAERFDARGGARVHGVVVRVVDDLRRVLSAGSRPNCTGGFGLKGVSRHPQHLSTF